ncbi:MAG: mercuric transporter MerT family protein, partial [Luteimonas sp.]
MASWNGKQNLVAGVLAAMGASVCCVAPFVLLSLGIGGAWVGNLTAMA